MSFAGWRCPSPTKTTISASGGTASVRRSKSFGTCAARKIKKGESLESSPALRRRYHHSTADPGHAETIACGEKMPCPAAGGGRQKGTNRLPPGRCGTAYLGATASTPLDPAGEIAGEPLREKKRRLSAGHQPEGGVHLRNGRR